LKVAPLLSVTTRASQRAALAAAGPQAWRSESPRAWLWGQRQGSAGAEQQPKR